MPKTAVLLPCYNEGLTIRRVVENFKHALPDATIYVYDNLSIDNTKEEALLGGAVVRSEPWPGKGNVVRRMFADIDSEIYVIADGDGTYDEALSAEMVRLLVKDNLDMVVGTRRNIYNNAHRTGHALGNRFFNSLYRSLFGCLFTDIFSGYRVFSRRFVKSFPAVSSGFEIETEMSVHASQLRMPASEMITDYGPRHEGSNSKLRTFYDGFRIFITLLLLFKENSPIRFFSFIALLFALMSLILAIPLFFTYLQTGLVPRFPTAILSTGLMLLAGLSITCGMILDSVARGRLEIKRLRYLDMQSVLSALNNSKNVQS